jgi:hypothetical protein
VLPEEPVLFEEDLDLDLVMDVHTVFNCEVHPALQVGECEKRKERKGEVRGEERRERETS